MIEIKSHFTNWHEVDIEQARIYCVALYHRMTMPENKRVEYIEKNHLRGITFAELVESGCLRKGGAE